MKSLVLLFALQAMATVTAQFVSIGCGTCPSGSSCQKVYNAATNSTTDQCLSNLPLDTASACRDSTAPLYSVQSGGNASPIPVGCSRLNRDCPFATSCTFAPNDAWAVCCPDRPGECPVPKDNEVGICANTCSRDMDCVNGERCCRNPCGATTCQSACPGGCGPGTRCEMVEVQCVTTPCPSPTPQCVAVEQGRCPRVPGVGGKACSADSECGSSEGCCESSGCGKTCQRLWGQLTCLTAKCSRGYACVMKKPESCSDGADNCFARPVCEKAPKSGECPSYHWSHYFSRRCTSDDTCRGVQKCCNNRCVAPREQCKRKCRSGYTCEVSRICFFNYCFSRRSRCVRERGCRDSQGVLREIGSSFPSDDGCNCCTCNANGGVSCTEKACVQPVTGCKDALGNIYEVGSSFGDTASCNACFCGEDGDIGCTEAFCPGCRADNGTFIEIGTSYFDGCNTCSCFKAGLTACTRRYCPPEEK